jgi:hypothetical protein
MMSEEQQSNVPIEKLVKIYLKIRTKREELTKQFEEENEALETQMKKIKGALLDHCKANNADSVRTPEGLFYRTIKRNYWTNDWESLHAFILDNDAPQLLEKRIHQGNMKEFLEENPDLLPPGLNVDSEYVLTIRRK